MSYSFEELMSKIIAGSQHFTNNVLRVSLGPDGKIQYSKGSGGPASSTPRGAMGDQAFGQKRVDVINPLDPGDRPTPRIGGLSYVELEDFARKSGLEIRRESWSVTEESLAYLHENLRDKNKGILIPGKDDVTVLRLYNKKGELSSEQAVDALKKHGGWTWYFDDTKSPSHGKVLTTQEILSGKGMNPKLAKRMRALVSLKQYASSNMKKLQVGVFDPTQLGELRQMLGAVDDFDKVAETAVDGISIINPATVKQLAKKMKAQARLVKYKASKSGSASEISAAAKEAEAIIKNAEELEAAAKTPGSRFNLRAMNLDLLDLETRKKVTGLVNGQIKGDTIVGRAKDFAKGKKTKPGSRKRGGTRKGGRFAGLDIVVARGGVTQQLGKEGTRSLLTLDPTRPKAGAARLDLQSISAFGSMFQDQTLVEETLRDAMGLYHHVAETGELPPQYLQDLRALADSDILPDDVLGMSPMDEAAAKLKRSEARQILDYIDAGYDPRKSPNILNMILESKEKELDRVRFGKHIPNFLIPDTIDAHVTNSLFARWALGVEVDVRPGQVRFHEQIGWIMDPEFFSTYYRAFGGGDQDDNLRVLLRASSGEGYGVSYRPPTTIGESIVLDIDFDDKSWEFVLKNRSDKTEYKQLHKINRQIEDIVNPKPKSGPFSDLSDLLDPDGTQAQARLGDLLSERRTLINGAVEKINHRTLTNIVRESFLGVADGEPAHPAFKMLEKVEKVAGDLSWWDSADAILEFKYQLEQYANTKMVMDNFLGDAGGLAAYVNPGSLSAIENELILDAITNPGSGGVDLASQNPMIRRQFGHTLAEAIHGALIAGKDITNMGVDESIFDMRLSAHSDDILAGIEEFNEEALKLHGDAYKPITLQDVMRQGRMTKLLKEMGLEPGEGVLGQLADLRKKTVAQHAYGPEILNALLDDEDARNIQNVFSAFQNALDDTADFIPRDITELIQENFGPYGALDVNVEKKQIVSQHVLAAISETFDDSGNATDRTYRVVAGLMQLAHGDGPSKHKADSILRTQYLGQLTAETDRWFDTLFIGPKRALSMDMIAPIIEGVTPDFTPTTSMEEAEDFKRAFNTDGILNGMMANKRNSARLNRVSINSMRKLADDVPAVKGGLVGAGALIAGSFLYQSHKGDRTPEDLQGPPLLPGGSPYETRASERMMQLNEAVMRSQEGGVVYNINVSGAGYDPSMIQAQIESITGGSVSGNIFDGGRSAQDDMMNTIRDSF